MDIKEFMNKAYQTEPQVHESERQQLPGEGNANQDLNENSSALEINLENDAPLDDDSFGDVDFKNLKLRLIGFYDEEGQYLNEEQKYPEQASMLARLLEKSFSYLEVISQTNEDIASVIAGYKNKAVFILRDEKFSLYAYWPYKKNVRLTNVFYNQSSIHQVPYVLKNWFFPGESFIINKKKEDKLDFYSYLKNNIQSGEKLSVSINGGKTIEGTIQSTGLDYFVISSNQSNQEFIISGTTIVMRGKQTELLSATDLLTDNNDDEDLRLEANGYVWKIFDKGGRIYDYSTQRVIPFLFDYNVHLNKEDIHINDQIIFKKNINKNGKTYALGLCPVVFTEACRICHELSRSSDSNQRNTGWFVFDNLRREFPEHEKVLHLQSLYEPKQNKSNANEDFINSVIEKAKEYYEIGNYSVVENIYIEALEKDSRILPELCNVFVKSYEEAEEDERDEIATKIIEFIDRHDKLFSDSNLGLRKTLLNSIGRQDLFVKFLDRNLNSCESNRIRAILLKNKALLYYGKDDELYREYLCESLALNPWDKVVEKNLNALLGYTNDEYRTISVAVTLDNDNIQKDTFLTSLFYNYSDILDSDTQRKYYEEQQDHSRINTSDYNTYTLKLIHCYKAINASAMPGKMLALYCGSRALSMARDNGNLSSIRFLLQKSMTYALGFGYFIRRSLYIYVYSHFVESGEKLYTSLPSSTDSLSFNDLFEDMLVKCKESWVDILAEVSYSNIGVRKYIVETCFNNERLKRQSSEIFINRYNYTLDETLKSYSNVWEKHIEMIQRKFNCPKEDLTIKKEKDLDRCIEYIKNLSEESRAGHEIQLLTLYSNLLEECTKTLNLQDIALKQRKSLDIKEKGEQILSEISSAPTKLLCSIIPQVKDLLELMDFHYTETRNSFKNKLSINPLSHNVAIAKDGNTYKTSIVLEVENIEGGLPIRDIDLKILRKGFEEETAFEVNYEFSISSGDSWECPCSIKLLPSEVSHKYIEFNINMRFIADSDSREHTYQKKFKINLYSEDEFVTIQNPFNPTSGKQLQIENKSMFYGRTDLLNELDEAFRAKDSYRHFIIYGQKRCGKSSFLNMLINRLSDCEDLFIVKFELPTDLKDEYDFYRVIINNVVEKITNDPNQQIAVSEIPNIREKYTSVEFFRTKFLELRKKEEFENKRLLLLIDEFTSLYDGIKSKHIKETILKEWKYIAEDSVTQFGAVLCGHDITPMFLAEDYNSNPSQILEQRKLTYLDKEDAKALITKPVYDGPNSRFVGKSVNRIMDYTARNPYYIQIFCHVLIDYLNKCHSYRVTLTDVENVARKLYCDSDDGASLYFSSIKSFDNLISNGRHSRWNDYKDTEIETILRIVAEGSKETGWCSRESIQLNLAKITSKKTLTKKKIDGILDDLRQRDIIKADLVKGVYYYQIRVLLFKEWLINHPVL